MKDITLAGYNAEVLDVPGDETGAKQLVLAAMDGSEILRYAIVKDGAQYLGRKLLGLHVVGSPTLPPAERNGDAS